MPRPSPMSRRFSQFAWHVICWWSAKIVTILLPKICVKQLNTLMKAGKELWEAWKIYTQQDIYWKTQYLLWQQQRFFKYAVDNQHKLTYLALLKSAISLGVTILCNFMSRVRKKQIWCLIELHSNWVSNLAQGRFFCQTNTHTNRHTHTHRYIDICAVKCVFIIYDYLTVIELYRIIKRRLSLSFGL